VGKKTLEWAGGDGIEDGEVGLVVREPRAA